MASLNGASLESSVASLILSGSFSDSSVAAAGRNGELTLLEYDSLTASLCTSAEAFCHLALEACLTAWASTCAACATAAVASAFTLACVGPAFSPVKPCAPACFSDCCECNDTCTSGAALATTGCPMLGAVEFLINNGFDEFNCPVELTRAGPRSVAAAAATATARQARRNILSR